MDQDVPEPGYWCNFSCKFRREHPQLAHARNGLVIVARLLGSFHGDDAVTYIDTAPSSDFKIAFGDVPQVGIAVKFGASFTFQSF